MTDNLLTDTSHSPNPLDTTELDPTPASTRPLIIVNACAACARDLIPHLLQHGFRVRLDTRDQCTCNA